MSNNLSQIITLYKVQVFWDVPLMLKITLWFIKLKKFNYRYPLLCPLENYCNVSIASIRDIAAMKIGAIGDRGARKDFYDMYAILNYTPIKIENILKG